MLLVMPPVLNTEKEKLLLGLEIFTRDLFEA